MAEKDFHGTIELSVGKVAGVFRIEPEAAQLRYSNGACVDQCPIQMLREMHVHLGSKRFDDIVFRALKGERYSATVVSMAGGDVTVRTNVQYNIV